MQIALFLLPFSLWTCSLCSWSLPDTFTNHPNRYFVETGSFLGDGIERALESGFTEIYSIDLEEVHIEQCKKRFEGKSQVHLFAGSSDVWLDKIIESIHEPITFWLDAHSCGEPVAGEVNNPILKELAIIAKHPIKTHTILIDDVRLFGTKYFDHITLSELIRKIKQINPAYQISYQDGFVKRDILVAKVT